VKKIFRGKGGLEKDTNGQKREEILGYEKELKKGGVDARGGRASKRKKKIENQKRVAGGGEETIKKLPPAKSYKPGRGEGFLLDEGKRTPGGGDTRKEIEKGKKVNGGREGVVHRRGTKGSQGRAGGRENFLRRKDYLLSKSRSAGKRSRGFNLVVYKGSTLLEKKKLGEGERKKASKEKEANEPRQRVLKKIKPDHAVRKRP